MGMGGPWKFRDQAGCDPESMITERCPVTVDVLGKVWTNETRGQPRDDLGDKQILMTSIHFVCFFFRHFLDNILLQAISVIGADKKATTWAKTRASRSHECQVGLYNNTNFWWGCWKAVVNTSVYEDEWVVVGSVGVVLEGVREILLMPQDGRRRGRTPF